MNGSMAWSDPGQGSDGGEVTCGSVGSPSFYWDWLKTASVKEGYDSDLSQSKKNYSLSHCHESQGEPSLF